MDKYEPLPKKASAEEPAEDSRRSINVSPENHREKLPGKTDSGPEPDVFGMEIPPQDED